MKRNTLYFFVLIFLFGMSLTYFTGCREKSTTAVPDPVGNSQTDAQEEASGTNPDSRSDSEVSETSEADEIVENVVPDLDIPDPDVPDDAETRLNARAAERIRPGLPLSLTPGVSEKDMLQRMIKEYQSAFAYGDHGKFVLEFEEGEPESWPCTFAFESPNLVRMEISLGQLVSNGEDIYGQMYLFDGQVLKIPAPNRLTLASLYPDRYLAGAMNLQIPPEIFLFPPQVVLLFAKDPMKTFVPENAKIFFEEPQWFDRIPCERIVVASPEGNRTYWIDRQTFALVRIDLPFDYLNDPTLNENPDDFRKVTAFRLEFGEAIVNPDIPKEAFQIEYPQDAVMDRHLAPWSVRLLGKKLDNYDTVAIRSLNNDKDIPLSRYADKINVLLFWTTESEDSGIGLKEVYEVYQKYKDDQRFRFIAVCCDEMDEVPNETVARMLGETWNTPLPSCRLPDFELLRSLHSYTSATLVVFEPQGVVSRYFPPGTYDAPILENALKEILDEKSPRSEIEVLEAEAQNEHEKMIRRLIDEDVFRIPMENDSSDSGISLAPKTLPESLQMEELFTIRSLRNPGNITVVAPQTPEDPPKFLVPFEQNSLALFDETGKIVDQARPNVFLSNESIKFVRSARDGSGKPFYVAFSPDARLHILDERFQSRGFYPKTRAEAEESVIFDARTADLDADGEPEIVLAMHDLSKEQRLTGKNPVYSGSVRVLKLDGTILWRNDEISFPYQIGIVYVQGHPTVVAMNVTDETAELYEFDSQGHRTRIISLDDGNLISWLVVDDTEGRGDSQICVYVPHRDEKNVMHLAEIDRTGVQDWKFPVMSLPPSVPVDRMIAADIVGNANKEWILNTPDGILHILDRKGKKLAEYAHGKTVTGFHGAAFGKRRMLLVADDESITAYEVKTQ